MVLISLSVIIFSWEYILGEKYYKGFHILVIVFVARIIILIFRPHLLRGMLGWDGLGLSSYLLVIYYSSDKSFNSGIITALTNRLGDGLLLLAIGVLSLNSEWRLKIICHNRLELRGPIFLLVIVGCCTKSAQIPFCAWLPAAIAAPTPVSSLVHSSTLVTAGVYLILRHESFLADLGISIVLLYLGMATILLSSLSALYECDIKKIVALSTLRQLGVIIVALGLGLSQVAFFHLLTHAFFKALLFVCTGGLIHSRNNYQDVRAIGISPPIKPFTGSFVLLSIFSLRGLPFISAFFSKEIILEYLISLNHNIWAYALFFFGALLTLLYSMRFLWLTYWGYSKKESLSYIEDSSFYNLSAMGILFIPAMLGGWVLKPLLFLSSSIFYSSLGFKVGLLGFLSIILMRSPAWFSSNNIILWTEWKHRLSIMWMLPVFRAPLWTNNISTPGVLVIQSVDRGVIRLFTRKLFSVSYWEFSFLQLSVTTQSKILILLLIWLVLILILAYWCIQKIAGAPIVSSLK